MVFKGETWSQCDNVINGGSVEANEFGCPAPVWDPSLITNVALPTGGTGNLEYVWIFTTNDPQAPLSQWSPLPNSNSPQYDPPPISVTTYYRRCARRAGCTDYVGESNIVVKEAICCDNVTNGGSIGYSQIFCEPPFNPNPFVNLIAPSGGSLALEFQWFMSSTGTPYSSFNPDWVAIPGTNSITYSAGSLSQTTHFIRLSRRHGCFDYDGVSNMVTVIIGEEINVQLSGNNESCLNGNDGSVAVANIDGGIPDYVFQWSIPGGSSNDTIIGLAPGIYTVTVTDAYGCSGTASQTLNPGPPLNVQTIVTAVSCPGDTDGKATAIVNDGLPPYSYGWNDPQAQVTQTAMDLAPSTYTVTTASARRSRH